MVRPLREVLRSPSLLTALKQDPAAFRFPNGASLVVAVKSFQPHTFVKEHEADDGSRSLTVTGPMKNLLDLLSSSINFSYTLVLPPDGTTGTLQPNHTWTGLVGMLTRKEADIALGPVVMTESLNTVVDFSQPVVIDSLRVMGLRGTPEVDLWGFVLPFRPMVWLAIGATLLVTWAIMTLMMKLVFYTNTGRCNAKHNARWTPFRIFFEHLRILLLQNREFVLVRGWEYLVFGSWMVVANVVLWSYGGKLISGLTVRYVAQPLHDLQQLIYHSSVVAILEQDTAYVQLLRDEASVTFRDLIALEKQGRMIFRKTTEFEVTMTTLMRKGGFAFIMQDLVITNLMAVDVTQTGNCDFYTSDERFHTSLMSIIAQKHSPFLEAINARLKMVNIPGLAGIMVFYLLILGIGVWAAWRRRKHDVNSEEVMLAGRSLGPFVGVLTMTATWVGGGYINGTAEKVYEKGLIWCQAPFGYAISLAIGGLFFAKPMRKAGYVTMLDPLQDAFGRRMGGLLYLPALMGETFWSAAILSALGSTLAVILNIDNTTSILVSAAVAVTYTLFGGLYSVVYTDVVQLFCIFIGLWLAVPFTMMNEAVGSLALNDTNWLGSIESGSPEWGQWIDYWLLLICGGIPWQVYFQRVLSSRSPGQAQFISFAASVGCIISAIPACIIGAVAKATDWSQTSYGHPPEGYQAKLVVPLVMQYLTPEWVAFMGLGAVSAAVMSSADSSVISASSMFARNIYTNVFRQKASEREVIWVMRAAIVVVAGIASTIGILIHSIYYLFKLCGDLVYVVLFPQLLMVVHFRQHVNTYGSFVAFCLGLVVRLLGGEPFIGVPASVRYPLYDEATGQQNFPFRTVAMVVSLTSLILVSAIAKFLFTRGFLPAGLDICECFDLASKNKHESAEFTKETKTHNGQLILPNNTLIMTSMEKNMYKPQKEETSVTV